MEQKCTDKRIKEETKAILEIYTQEKDNLITILNEIQEK